MILKKPFGLSCTIIGILIPLFSTVCIGSTGGAESFSLQTIHVSGISSTILKVENPRSENSLQQDIHFIHRVKKNGYFLKADRAIERNKFNCLSPTESSFVSSFPVRRPAYYNYLFRFKPFESQQFCL